jgi:hypothetical protein
MTDDSRQDESAPSYEQPERGEFLLREDPALSDEANRLPADRTGWPQSALLAEAAVREAFEQPAEQKQFTLRDMFALVTFCAVLSLPLSHLPRPVFAGLIGGVTVMLMIVQTFFESRHALIRYGWWALLGVYLMACAMAVAGV